MTSLDLDPFFQFSAELRGLMAAEGRAAPSTTVRAFDSDSMFTQLALRLFQLQYDSIPPYQSYCRSLGIRPGAISDWSEIPAIPTSAFKEFDLTSIPEEMRTKVFFSSGTSQLTRSRHFHSAPSLQLYEESLRPWFRNHVLAEIEPAEQPDFVILTPPPVAAPNSSLVHMFATAAERFASSAVYLATVSDSGSWQLQESSVLACLDQAARKTSPQILLGTAFSFVHLLDLLRRRHIDQLRLPPRSVAMETGGYKGQSREVPKEVLHRDIGRQFHLDSGHLVCEYGMSELSSQAYDRAAGPAEHNANGSRIFRFPPWARIRVISPETLKPARAGELGILQIFDLANVFSIFAVQTGDIAVQAQGGFQLIGRASTAEPKGCSLTQEAFG